MGDIYSDAYEKEQEIHHREEDKRIIDIFEQIDETVLYREIRSLLREVSLTPQSRLTFLLVDSIKRDLRL